MSNAAAELEILRPFITDRIQSLVRSRLLDGERFFENHVLRPCFIRPEVKLALLLVRIANPDEPLIVEEEKVLTARPQVQNSISSKGAK